MKIKKSYRLLSIVLLFTLIIQPMQMIKAQAASGGSVVTGASGIQYTLEHEYVKQLNINTGSITITDSNYTQTNGLTESWDANEDAYVIKGQGTSTNSITINTTNYPVTIYLLEAQWLGNIIFGSSSNTASVKIVILGDVSCARLIKSSYSTTTSKQVIEVHGYNENSNLTATYLMSSTSGKNVRIGTLLIDGVNVSCNKITEITSSGTSGNMSYWAVFLNNLTIKNSKITQSTATTDENGKFYFTYVATDNGSISIENSTVSSSIAFDEGATSTSGLKPIIISNSKISSVSFAKIYASTYMSYTNTFSVTAENTTINNAVFDSNVDTVSLKNSVLKAAVITKQKLYLDGSTAANSGTTLSVPVYSFNHSSFNSYGTNWILNQTPTDSDGNDLFLKKVRFRDYPNTYILTTFQDGSTSKLLTDENGYLYPYIPRNNTTLQFQITNETGNVNYGNYDLDFEAITANDTSASVPAVTVQPTTVTFSPYANTNIEYSFDRVSWISTITDANCSFSVVFPTGVRKIYLRYNGSLYSIDTVESGNPSDAIQLKPKITSQSPGNVSLLKDKEGSIYVNASPVNTGAALDYQWYKDGSLLEGETSNVLAIKNPDEIDEGMYTCIVTEDGIGSTTSSPIAISITNGLPEETVFGIAAQSGNKTVTEDSKVEFYVIPNTIDGISYQWKKNGTDIAEAITATYEIESVKQVAKGTYTCVLTRGSEEITSNPIVLTVEPNPLSGDISNLQNTVNALTIQVNTLQGQLDTANINVTSLQDTIDTLTGKITDLDNQIADLQEQINNLSGNVADLQSQITALQVQKSNLQTELDVVNAEKASLQVTINELTIEVSNKGNLIMNLQSLLDASENENDELKSQIAVLNEQIINMTTLIESLNVQITTLNSERDSLQNQLNTANVTISSQQQQILDLTSENDDLKSQLESALNQIVNLQGQVASLSTQNISLERQVDDLKSQIAELQKQLGEGGEGTSELQQQISTLTTQANNQIAVINQKEEQISALNEQIVNLNEIIVNLQLEVNQAMESLSRYEGLALQDRINQVLTENAQLKDSLSSLIQEREDLLYQIPELNSLIQGLQDENTSLSQQLQGAEELINNLQSSLATEISKSNDLQAQVSTLNNQINELQQQLDQSDSDKDTLSQKIANLQIDLSNLSDKLHEADKTIQDLTGQIAGLNITIINLQTQINNALSELSEYEGNDLVEKIENIKAKQSDITADLNEASALNTSLNSQLDTANIQLSSLQQQIDILTGQLNDKDAKIAELLVLIADMDKEISSKNTIINDLQNKIQTLQTTIDTLFGGNDEIKKLTQQVNDLMSQINTLNVRISELTGNIAEKDTQINQLDAQLASKNNEIGNLNHQIADLDSTDGSQAEITKLTDQLDKAKNVICNLQQQLEDLKQIPVIVVTPDDSTPENSDGAGITENNQEPDKLNTPVFTMYKTVYFGYSYLIQINNADGKALSFSSSDNMVAKVSKTGLITTIKNGKAIITCTAGNNYVCKIVVTVADGKGLATLNLITPKIQTMDENPVLLMYKQVKKGSSTKLRISGLDKGAKVTYINMDSNVAIISKDGVISGVNKGDTDIWVIVTQGNLHYIYYVKIRVDDGTRDSDMWDYLIAA
ncbi:Ig-like domain-containing protein [Anaerocolumna xylanovorans]|uniref:Immunoglobulin domain n=1 Tax=Anaerocolumna xylanovorans DSM 12503 TaxID=1121345 RepID=A0A1M7YNE7_9FIRM|nr:Ig-like domain-containing protein [Anaerocolumna xylanovorans]SHO54174.1 Immunoglobulin domain [Anaerocolumna xylanovorans DSM 12503]